MPLFQSAVLKKYLKQQDEARVAQAYAVFTAYFHNAERQQNILNAKEEQFQEGFPRPVQGLPQETLHARQRSGCAGAGSGDPAPV